MKLRAVCSVKKVFQQDLILKVVSGSIRFCRIFTAFCLRKNPAKSRGKTEYIADCTPKLACIGHFANLMSAVWAHEMSYSKLWRLLSHSLDALWWACMVQAWLPFCWWPLSTAEAKQWISSQLRASKLARMGLSIPWSIQNKIYNVFQKPCEELLWKMIVYPA